VDLTNGIVAVASACLGGGAAGFFAWLTTKTKAPADVMSAQAAFQIALNTQSDAFMKRLQDDRDGLQSRVNELLTRVEALERENVECRGENAQLHQLIESLEANLARSGIIMPARRAARSFIVMEGGKVTTMTPDAAAPARSTPKPRRRRKPKEST
jgi:septal ring factor EnvC (AmiA/AmiB activator)